MAYLDTFTPCPPVRVHATTGLSDWIAQWRQARRARAGHRQTEAQLASLDDRILKDIGLTRSEIGSAARDCSGERLRSYDPRWYESRLG